MYQIFQDYNDNILDGDITLKDAYSRYHNVSVKWLKCENITIKSLLNRICDEFESNGFDLDELPLENIRDSFVKHAPVVSVPLEYTQLTEAKQYTISQLDSIKQNETLMSLPDISSVIAQIESTIESIDNELLKLV